MGRSDATQYHMHFRLLGNHTTRVSETVKAYEANGRLAGGNDNSTMKVDEANGRKTTSYQPSTISPYRLPIRCAYCIL
eukprot:252951-Amorphochlora_amoeboformis.AAC.1